MPIKLKANVCSEMGGKPIGDEECEVTKDFILNLAKPLTSDGCGTEYINELISLPHDVGEDVLINKGKHIATICNDGESGFILRNLENNSPLPVYQHVFSATRFEKGIMAAKKERFKQYVEQASLIYGLEYMPQVVFVEGFSQGVKPARADIELGTWVIRVYLGELEKMPDEQIKKTAFHEVTHIFDPTHEKSFTNKLDDIMLGTWEPPSGVIHKIGGQHLPPIEHKEPEIDMEQCNYYQADVHRNGKETLKQCPHCQKYFCKEHFEPRPPNMPDFDYPNKENDWGASKDGHHPCPPYYDFIWKEEKERQRRYQKSLDRMKKVDWKDYKALRLQEVTPWKEGYSPDERARAERESRRTQPSVKVDYHDPRTGRDYSYTDGPKPIDKPTLFGKLKKRWRETKDELNRK